jgi:hypothetical protein
VDMVGLEDLSVGLRSGSPPRARRTSWYYHRLGIWASWFLFLRKDVKWAKHMYLGMSGVYDFGIIFLYI